MLRSAQKHLVLVSRSFGHKFIKDLVGFGASHIKGLACFVELGSILFPPFTFHVNGRRSASREVVASKVTKLILSDIVAPAGARVCGIDDKAKVHARVARPNIVLVVCLERPSLIELDLML